MRARSRVEVNEGAVYEYQRGGCVRVRLIYDVGALAPKIVMRCGASPSVFVIMLLLRLRR